jgi:hypothetical protein
MIVRAMKRIRMKTPCAKMPEIINNQRKIKIERPLFQKFAETAAVKLPKPKINF